MFTWHNYRFLSTAVLILQYLASLYFAVVTMWAIVYPSAVGSSAAWRLALILGTLGLGLAVCTIVAVHKRLAWGQVTLWLGVLPHLASRNVALLVLLQIAQALAYREALKLRIAHSR